MKQDQGKNRNVTQMQDNEGNTVTKGAWFDDGGHRGQLSATCMLAVFIA